MKKVIYFLSVILISALLILTSCSDKYSHLQKYQFKSDSDPEFIYATSEKAILEDRGNIILEEKGNFYKLPVELKLERDNVLFLSPNGQKKILH
ncbi:hypothetical protein [Thermoanaerobacter wiegelii]|uniref:hypothetical protein n=1 Tax=Thermoanaerobacter wiegelii TaxID=46354 RepID=UPI0001E4F864|nr:hypothetical protein [Thermoanaerobacter wiegelii]